MAHGSEWLCAYLESYEAETKRQRHRLTPKSLLLRWRQGMAYDMRAYLLRRGQQEIGQENLQAALRRKR